MITATVRYYAPTRARGAIVEATAVWQAGDKIEQESVEVPARCTIRGSANNTAVQKLTARLRARGLAGQKLTIHYR